MKHIGKYLVVLSLTIFVLGVHAQSSFDRVYTATDRSQIALDLQVDDSGNYFVLSQFFSTKDNEYSGLNVTKLMPKGDVDWTKDYILEDSLLTENIGTLILNEEGELLVASVSADTSLYLPNLLFKLDAAGDVTWSRSYGHNPLDSIYADDMDIVKGTDGEYKFFGGALSENGEAIIGLSLNEDGGIVWSRSQVANVEIGPRPIPQLFEVNVALDSSLILTGTLDTVDVRTFYQKMAMDGTEILSKAYGAGSGTNLISTDIVSDSDSTSVITGLYLDNNNFILEGFVMQVDSIGNVNWAKHLSLIDGLGISFISEVAISSNGLIQVSGETIKLLEAEITTFVLYLGRNGEAISQNLFPRSSAVGALGFGQLVSTQDGGVALATTMTPDLNGSDAYSRLLKLTKDGSSSCEDTIMTNILVDFTVLTDTLTWTINAIQDTFETFEIVSENFGDYTVPILTLRDTMYCPGDPVMFLLDATVPGAVSYTWNTMDTTATIIAEELDVDYIVDVRIDDMNCFNLCDTTQLTDIDPPVVQIGVSNARYCDEGLFQIFASGAGDSILWSTGESGVGNILVSELGTYSVTITNQCDDSDNGSITIGLSDLPPAVDPIIQKNFDQICATPQMITLNLVNASEFINIQWTRGGTVIPGTNSISVGEPGTYNLTAEHICGREVTGSVTVAASDFYNPATGITDNCSNGNYSLSVGPIEDAVSIAWSTGETFPSINVECPSSFSVDITDICNNTLSFSFDVGASDLKSCQVRGDTCMMFPNVFIPFSQLNQDGTSLIKEVNQSFGPYSMKCGNVTEYKLQVFNRWGQKVYESTDVTETWDGTFKGQDAPNEVYVYVAEYIDGCAGLPFFLKGSVTLLR